MTLGTLYLLAAAILLFGAGIFSAKRCFPHLQTKQISLIAVIAFVTVGLIWVVLDVTGRKSDSTPISPATQPSQLPLQPDPDQS